MWVVFLVNQAVGLNLQRSDRWRVSGTRCVPTVRCLKQIGQQLGVSRERVRQMQLEALVWLRQPAHSQELRSLLARHTQAQYELADELAAVWLKQRGGRHGR